MIHQMGGRSIPLLSLGDESLLSALLRYFFQFFVNDFTPHHFQQSIIADEIFFLHVSIKEEIHVNPSSLRHIVLTYQ